MKLKIDISVDDLDYFWQWWYHGDVRGGEEFLGSDHHHRIMLAIAKNPKAQKFWES